MCAVHYIYSFILDGPVSCGMHQAMRCLDCPGANGGPPMCNGQCKWDYASNACLNKGKFDTPQSLAFKFLSYWCIVIFSFSLLDIGIMGDWKGANKKQNHKKRLLHQKHRVPDTPFGNLRGLEHEQNNDYGEATYNSAISTNHGNIAKESPVPLLRNPIQGNITYLFTA